MLDDKVRVAIDRRQLEYVRREYPAGSQVPLLVENGAWRILSRPAAEDAYTPDDETSLAEILVGDGERSGASRNRYAK